MQLERHDAIAVLTLNAGKANAIGPDFLSGLERLWAEFEASDASAAVLTGYERFFCAGLDLVTLAALDRPAMRVVMQRFHDAMRAIFMASRPVVAAVNGHAIAGGCVLALQADWRVLADGKTRIGLNEAQLGVGLPICAVESLRARIPPTSWLPLALEGRICEPEEGLVLGLIDALAEPEDVLATALERATELARIPPLAYAQIKRSWAEPYRAAMDARFDEDLETWLDGWFSDDARARVAAAIAGMRAKQA